MTLVRKVKSFSPSEIRKWVARMLGVRRQLALIHRHGPPRRSRIVPGRERVARDLGVRPRPRLIYRSISPRLSRIGMAHRWSGDLCGSNATSGVARGDPTQSRANCSDSESASTTALLVFLRCRLFESQDDFDCLFIFDDLGMPIVLSVSHVASTDVGSLRNVPFGEVPGILVKRVIAAEDVYEGQDDLVWRVVDVYSDPADSLVAFA
jgi:hypothetical protein